MVFVLHGQAFGHAQRIFVAIDTCCSGVNLYDQITRRLVAQRVAPAARVILSQTQAFGDRGYQIRRRRRAARSLTSQGTAEPLCARIESVNREVSEGKADL